MAGLALALFLGRVSAAGVSSVFLSATPEAIPANGETGSTIVATVYDGSSRVVGETVYFAATVYDHASQQVSVTVYLNPSSALTTSPDGQATTVLRVYEPDVPATIEGARVQVTATAGTVTGTVYVGLYNSPHGRYTHDTNACFLCHGSHSANTPRLLKVSDSVSDSVYDSVYDAVYALPIVAPLCLSCHDGTGSQYNVKSAFLLSGENASHHPVRGVDNPAVQRLLNCTACHNVHGDSKPGGGIYPRLLRQLDYTYTSVGTKVYEGPKFCLTCHGPVDRYWGGKPGDPDYYDYYTEAAGDHSNEYAVHYETDGVGNRALLLPASGTKVTCVRCHDQHAASGRWLAGGEESVCFSCHNSTGTSINGINIQERFTYSGYDEMGKTGSSRHDIYSNTGAKVECTSCHGPHTVSAVVYDAVYSVSDISDPENTKKYFAQVESDAVYTEVYRPGVTVGGIVDFCLRCHDGTPPQAVNKYVYNASRTQFVPYTILFPSWIITTNAGGWDKSAFTQSGHYNYTLRRILCTTCHDSHGTQYPRLLTLGEDTNTANGQCLTCHDGNNVDYPGARDVKTDLTKSSRHVTLYVYGKHGDREDYENMLTDDRHAECADCHDPHASRPYNEVGGIPQRNNPPAILGPNLNVSGVQSNYTSISSGDIPVHTFAYSVAFEYNICFKCHTAYSWGGSRTGPVVSSETTGIGQPDKGMEFNPDNPSFHPVVQQGRNGGISSGAFVSPWDADDLTYCSDCHGRNETDSATTTRPYGPHGSTNAFILKGPVTRIGGGGVTANEVCFRCHGKGVYYDGDRDGGNNHYTRFAGTVSGSVYCSGDTGGRVSLHCYHVKEKDRPCLACHASHGTMRSNVVTSVYDDETGYYFTHESLDPAHNSDCQTPENCWRGAKRLLAFRGAASVTEGVYGVRWNETAGGPNRCYSKCHTSNPREWTPAYGYGDR